MQHTPKARRGSALMLVLIFMTAMLMLGLPLLMAAQMSVTREVAHTAVTGQYYAAEAAVQVAAQEYFKVLNTEIANVQLLLQNAEGEGLSPQEYLEDEDNFSPVFYMTTEPGGDTEKEEAAKDYLEEELKDSVAADMAGTYNGVDAELESVILEGFAFEPLLKDGVVPAEGETPLPEDMVTFEDEEGTVYYFFYLKTIDPEITARAGGTEVTLAYGYDAGVSVTIAEGEPPEDNTHIDPNPIQLNGVKEIQPNANKEALLKKILDDARDFSNALNLEGTDESRILRLSGTNLGSQDLSAKDVIVFNGNATLASADLSGIDIVIVNGDLTINCSKPGGSITGKPKESGGTTFLVKGGLKFNAGAQDQSVTVTNCRFYVSGNITTGSLNKGTGILGNSIYIAQGDIIIDVSGNNNPLYIGSQEQAPQFYARGNFVTDMWASSTVIHGIYAVLGTYRATDSSSGNQAATAPSTNYPNRQNQIYGGLYAPNAGYPQDRGKVTAQDDPKPEQGPFELPDGSEPGEPTCDMMDILFEFEGTTPGGTGPGDPPPEPEPDKITNITFTPSTGDRKPVIYDSTGENRDP